MPCTKPKLGFMHKFVKVQIRVTGHSYSRLRDGSLPHNNAFIQKFSDWRAIPVPCHGCTWCRLQNARDKGVRAFHEASLYRDNCFITLTYSNEHLPANGSIDPPRVQKFMKDLRDKVCRDFCKLPVCNLKTGRLQYVCTGRCPKIRSFGCAEYGEKLSRPHYHIVLFNFNFPDLKFWRYSRNDWSTDKWPVYRSSFLESLWPEGFSEVGTVTFKSASYVARYCVKKVKGKLKDAHYGDRLPERPVAVSNRRGIGFDWLMKHSSQVLKNDFFIVDGVKHSVGRYYSKKLDEFFPDDFLLVKERRLAKIKAIDLNGTSARLSDLDFIYVGRSKRLKRGFEL